MINTRFWIDDYISNLDPIEKLLFLYLLTNPATDISGCYELPLKHMALDTGIEKEMLIKVMTRFSRDHKVHYSNGWVGIVNFRKHQSLNPKVIAGIEIGLSKAPKELLDRLSKPIDSLSHLNSNLNSNSNDSTGDARGAEKSIIKKERTKRKPKPIVWEEYLKKMDDSPQEHVQLIAYYFRTRGISFDTDLEAETAISRHSRAAVQVVRFGKDRVFAAVDECEIMWKKRKIRYTIDTILKELIK